VLAARIVARLAAGEQSLAVAESCTGGWLGAAITSVPGASAVFWGGVIAYDDAAKRRLLAVSPSILESDGAVSEATAREMAAGVRSLSEATWTVAITGLAGPDGGSVAKPVGTVCIAVAGPEDRVQTLNLKGDRHAVRRQAVHCALAILEEALVPHD
jgi:PncC family amidohydrolase